MSDEPSPWPERRRTQHLLVGAGAALLVPVAADLAGPVDLGGTAVVGLTTVASALLVYGLLGWAGQWVEGGEAGEVADRPAETDEGDGPDEREESDTGDGDTEDGHDAAVEPPA